MSAFRTISGNRYLQGLFFEQTHADKSTVVYTLKDSDHLGFPSLYRLYMEEGDPLEFRFAQNHLDGYEHWLMLCDCTWFRPYVERWRKELELKIRSEALVRVIADSKSGSRSSAASNRLLLERGWAREDRATKGRPTKSDIKAEAKRLAEATTEQAADLARMLQSDTPRPVN